jgi:hypothetical protein
VNGTADLAAVNAALAHSMAALVHQLAGEPSHRGGDTLRFRSKGSLAIIIAGAKRGEWYDHEAGAGGDPVGLVAHLLRLPMREAFRWALDWLAEAPGASARTDSVTSKAAPCAPSEASATRNLARTIWAEAQPAAGTLAEAYLRARGIALEPGMPLRFHPSCPRGAARLPALVALLTCPVTAAPVGVHRTFLAAEGGTKAPPGPNGEPAKMMAGGAGVVRLTPDVEVTAGLGIAEGIETALAVAQAFGWRPIWAAASAGGIARFPVLAGLEALTVFADPDGAGLAAARSCCARWNKAGRDARLLYPPAGDFNDLAKGAT